MGRLETLEGVVAQGDQVIQGLLGRPVQMVLLGNQVRLDQTARKENQDDQLKVQTRFQEILGHQENQDLLVYQDLMDSLVATDNLVKLVHQDLQDHLDLWDLLERLEILVSQGNLDLRVSAESVPNIVPWMEVSSSKMERDAKRFHKHHLGCQMYICIYVINVCCKTKEHDTTGHSSRKMSHSYDDQPT